MSFQQFTGVITRRSTRRSLLLAATVGALVVSRAHTVAQTIFEVVADLTDVGASQPYGGVIRGADGAFYGTAFLGGAANCGIVYRLGSGGALTVLHDFVFLEGCNPVGELALGPEGDPHGITYSGGDSGGGTLFKVALDGTFTRFHSFDGYPSGHAPYAGLTLGPDGLFYGTTLYGAQSGGGIIFRISPQGDGFTILSGGTNQQAAFTRSSDSQLYGTDSGYGGPGSGSVFQLTTANGLTTVHVFPPLVPGSSPQICPEGAAPLGELVEGPRRQVLRHDRFCGPNGNDQGTIFRVTPEGVLTTLHVFEEGSESGTYPGGAAPWAGLTLGSDGYLYGITSAGGEFSNGILFRLSLAGEFTLLRSLTATEGGGSQESRLFEESPGVFYGTNAGGFIFKLTTTDNHAPVVQSGAAATSEDQRAKRPDLPRLFALMRPSETDQRSFDKVTRQACMTSAPLTLRKRTSVFLDEDLRDGLKALKRRDGTPEAEAIRRAIADYFDRRGVTLKSERKRAATRKRF